MRMFVSAKMDVLLCEVARLLSHNIAVATNVGTQVSPSANKGLKPLVLR